MIAQRSVDLTIDRWLSRAGYQVSSPRARVGPSTLEMVPGHQSAKRTSASTDWVVQRPPGEVPLGHASILSPDRWCAQAEVRREPVRVRAIVATLLKCRRPVEEGPAALCQ